MTFLVVWLVDIAKWLNITRWILIQATRAHLSLNLQESLVASERHSSKTDPMLQAIHLRHSHWVWTINHSLFQKTKNSRHRHITGIDNADTNCIYIYSLAYNVYWAYPQSIFVYFTLAWYVALVFVFNCNRCITNVSMMTMNATHQNKKLSWCWHTRAMARFAFQVK